MKQETKEGVAATVVVVGVAVLIVLIALGGWAFKVAFSDTKGKGDATVIKNSAENRIAKQEEFEDLYAEYEATLAKITTLSEAAEADPTQFNKTNLTGAKTYCASVVADYNALSRKYTASQFRAIDLPASLDAGTC